MVTTLFGDNQDYRRLSRSRTTLVGSWSLWEGSDHFVQMEVLGFHETHQRFYFEDIRAFTVRITSRGFWMHLLLGGLTVTAAGIGLWSSSGGFRETIGSGETVDWILLLAEVSFALAWLVHAILGPTCVCHVVTPVQNARLRAIGRIRTARKILFHLQYRAELVQGPVSGEISPPDTRPMPRPEVQVLAKKEEAGSSLVRMVATSLALLNAVFLGAFLVWDSYVLRVVQLLLTDALLGVGISCAATSRAAGVLFRKIGWALFTVNGLVFLLWYGYGVYMTSISRPPRAGFEVNFAWDMLQTSPHTSAFWFWVVVLNAVFSAVVGFVGLFAHFQSRKRNAQSA